MNEMHESDIAAVTEDVAAEKGEHLDINTNEPEARDEGHGEAQTNAPCKDTLPASSQDSVVADTVEREGELPVSNGGNDGAEQYARRKELSDMLKLYPEVRFSDIPEEVWGSQLPLAAAYALYCRKKERDLAVAEKENRRNRERSAGGIAPMEENYFSPEEVRRMTQKEVRQHYDVILSSMTRWR